MQLNESTKRDTSIDFLRGTAILFMMITHIQGTFFLQANGILDRFTWWGTIVCFTTFIFCFGFIYGITAEKTRPASTVAKRIIKLLLAYYFCAFTAELLLSGSLSISKISSILLLSHLPQFTEFIITFGLYAIIMAFVPGRYLKKENTLIIVIVTVLLYIISIPVSRNYPQSIVLQTIQSQIFGLSDKYGIHSFAILPYMPVFIYGLLAGIHKLTHRQYLVLLVIQSIAAIFLGVTGLSTEVRWPPSMLFLLYGTIYLTAFMYIYTTLQQQNLTRIISFVELPISYMGKHSMSYLICSTPVILGLSFILDKKMFSYFETILLDISLILVISLCVRFIGLVKSKYHPV